MLRLSSLDAKSALLNLARANAWEVKFLHEGPAVASVGGGVTVTVHVLGDVGCSHSADAMIRVDAERLACTAALSDCVAFIDRHVESFGSGSGGLKALRRRALRVNVTGDTFELLSIQSALRRHLRRQREIATRGAMAGGLRPNGERD